MTTFSQTNLEALETTAITAAAYLDAADSGAHSVRLDPRYYQACGNLLVKIFSLVDAGKAFPILMEQSAAAREVAESIQIGQRLEINRRVFYPNLAVLLNRAAA